jgi:hypothetical protein
MNPHTQYVCIYIYIYLDGRFFNKGIKRNLFISFYAESIRGKPVAECYIHTQLMLLQQYQDFSYAAHLHGGNCREVQTFNL